MDKKKSYKEKLQHGQGYDLEPKTPWEIKKDKSDSRNREFDEERRLSGVNLDHYYRDDQGLGSPIDHDDYGDESFA